MGMHKGMCGRTESNGPASVETLGTYLNKKYPEEMKKKLTFEQWYNTVRKTADITNEYRYDIEYFMEMAWKAGQENV